ncbi:MAG: hypothetical protein IAG10_23310 [Planctomycetaceae bacterium]|nr:hypothetical protein [Planctomycetaceae bacterium]
MPINDPLPDEFPMVEVWLDVGDALRLGDRVLRVLDTDGDDTMLRLDRATLEDEDDGTCWAELPR